METRTDTEHPGVYAAFSHTGHGVMLLDDAARVLFANEAARCIVDTADGLVLHQSRLRATCAAQSAQLHRLLSNAIAPQPSDSALAIMRTRSSTPLALRIAAAPPADGRRRALVLIVDPERTRELASGRLQELFGLTAAEAAVALRVMRGDKLQAVASELRVTLSTVRVHLQRVYEKTGVHRQPQLVRLLLAVAAVFNDG